jgi:nicotinamidase-related amidase
MNLDLRDTVFVCVDIQPRERRLWTAQNIDPEYVRLKFTLQELNDSVDHYFDVMLPNAVALANWARDRGLPRIFVHWAQSRPREDLGVATGDFVIGKTEMDAFLSSSIAAVLAGIGRKTLLMVGGHTQGCLGRTAASAILRGYRCVCVRDATWDCSHLRWPRGIAAVAYEAVVSTADVLGR